MPLFPRINKYDTATVLFRLCVITPVHVGERFAALDSWSAYIITAYEEAEKYMGRKAEKNRKIYNGMMKTYLYQFLGPKPPRRPREEERE